MRQRKRRGILLTIYCLWTCGSGYAHRSDHSLRQPVGTASLSHRRGRWQLPPLVDVFCIRRLGLREYILPLTGPFANADDGAHARSDAGTDLAADAASDDGTHTRSDAGTDLTADAASDDGPHIRSDSGTNLVHADEHSLGARGRHVRNSR